jgi:hypothetical protein
MPPVLVAAERDRAVVRGRGEFRPAVADLRVGALDAAPGEHDLGGAHGDVAGIHDPRGGGLDVGAAATVADLHVRVGNGGARREYERSAPRGERDRAGLAQRAGAGVLFEARPEAAVADLREVPLAIAGTGLQRDANRADGDVAALADRGERAIARIRAAVADLR